MRFKPTRVEEEMLKTKKHETSKASPLSRFFDILDFAKLEYASWILVCLVTIYVKWATSIWGFSGEGVEPMHGDYEAQRHWMEITLHKPISEWYRYDLQYWGLDYPPLTAYVSWLCGVVANSINPEWVALDVSRGYESKDSRVFMRATVLISDLLIYTPAVFYFAKATNHGWKTRDALAMLILLQPALILIDHGHFQYNSIMLGLALWAVNSFVKDADILGSVLFCLSLGFKQMALYYAPAIFAYLLGKSYAKGPRDGIIHVVKLGIAVIVTFGVLFAPFLTNLDDITQVIIRLFPFARGLFEDKVANFWCALNVIYKLKRYSIATLGRISLLTTLVALLPSSIMVFMKPTPRQLILAMTSSSLAFFLFSFQVHEKSILLPLLPITLLISEHGEWAVFVNNIACFSMYRLLLKDGQAGPYLTLTAFWIYLNGSRAVPKSTPLKFIAPIFYTGAIIAHLAEFVYEPPSRYPDLYAVINVLISAPAFGISALYYLYQQAVEADLLGVKVTANQDKDKKTR